MRSFIKTMVVPFFTLAIAALGLQACGSETNGGGRTCIPNTTQTCTCNGMDTGVQKCLPSGGFDECNCSGGSTGGNGGAGGNGTGGNANGGGGGAGGGNCHALPNTPASCGDGKVDMMMGEQCDDGNCDPTDMCNNNCQNPYCGDKVVQPHLGETCDGGENCSGCGIMMMPDAGSDAGPTCQGQLVFAGLAAPTNGAFTFGGSLGKEAAKKACLNVNNGYEMCDYDQWKQIEGDAVAYMADHAKLAQTITSGTCQKLWLQRDTIVTIGAMVYTPGPGGNCNNWNYGTDHSADGEWIEVCNNVGAITFKYELDPKTTYIGEGMNGPFQDPNMPCSAMRPIPCCYKKCIPTMP